MDIPQLDSYFKGCLNLLNDMTQTCALPRSCCYEWESIVSSYPAEPKSGLQVINTLLREGESTYILFPKKDNSS